MTELKKYPKIKRIGHAENNGILEDGWLVVKEKLDGANFRFTYCRNKDRIVFGSRNIEYWNEKDVDKAFDHAIEFVRETVDIEELAYRDKVEGPLTFFGEAMHAHTIDYNWDTIPSFLGFDIYDHETEQFLNSEIVTAIFERLDLPTVPTVYDGWANELDGLDAPESEYYDGPAEGVVVVNEETGQRAKVRSEKFKEMHSNLSVADSLDYDPSDAALLAQTFTTEARVLKLIHKYEDRGRTIEMAIMEDLWREIFDDIIDEEYETIFLGNHTIDTKEFRSEVASITADVLQSYIQRPTDSVLNQ